MKSTEDINKSLVSLMVLLLTVTLALSGSRGSAEELLLIETSTSELDFE